jgi:hypothetical protein
VTDVLTECVEIDSAKQTARFLNRRIWMPHLGRPEKPRRSYPGAVCTCLDSRATQHTRDLVKRGAMMPMSLYQDDGYLVRFILGELSQQEQAEWTARAIWKLDISCGEVLVSGILTPDFNDEFSAIVSAEANGSYWAGAYIGPATGRLSSRGIQLPARRPVGRLGYDYKPSNIRETSRH